MENQVITVMGANPVVMGSPVRLLRVGESVRTSFFTAVADAGFEIVRAPSLPWPELPDGLDPQDPLPDGDTQQLRALVALLDSTLGTERARLGVRPAGIEPLAALLRSQGFPEAANELETWADAVAVGTAPRDPVACELEVRGQDLHDRWRRAEMTRIRPDEGRELFRQLVADREALTAQLIALCGDVPLRELAAPPAGWSGFRDHIRALWYRQSRIDAAVSAATEAFRRRLDELATGGRLVIDAPIGWLEPNRLLDMLDDLDQRGVSVALLVEVAQWPGRRVDSIEPVDQRLPIELPDAVQSIVDQDIWLPDAAVPAKRRALRSLLRLG